MKTSAVETATEPRRSATGRVHSPTRETLLRMLEAQRAPVSIAALARATGWHQNTVRSHVHALWEDGYLHRSREAPGDRPEAAAGGRPSWLWQAKDRAPGSPYAALAGVLAETLARVSPEPEREALEAGRSWGHALGGGSPSRSPVTPDEAQHAVIEALRDQGFAPHVMGRDAAGLSIELRQCPLIEAASKHSEVVCAVHRGMITGLLEASGTRDAGSELLPFASPGRCSLRLRVAA